MNPITEKFIVPIQVGDMYFIANSVINPKTGKHFSYTFIRLTLNGTYENKVILKFAKKYLRMKEKLVKDEIKKYK